MKRAIITGATGMVGSLVLKHCLESDAIDKVVSFGRRKAAIENEKLTQVIVEDFLNLEKFAQHFVNVDVAYYCLGAYTGAVDDERFKSITYNYTAEFVDKLQENSSKATFCLLSGQGADRSEKSNISFAKYKGMAENHLFNAKLANAFSFRPGYIYPVTKRNEPNLMYSFSRAIYPLIKMFGKKWSITSQELATAIFKVGMEGTEKQILENEDILNVLSN